VMAEWRHFQKEYPQWATEDPPKLCERLLRALHL
jgi:hypothetical protein